MDYILPIPSCMPTGAARFTSCLFPLRGLRRHLVVLGRLEVQRWPYQANPGASRWWAVSGDSGFLYGAHAMATAAQEGLHVVVRMFNGNGLHVQREKFDI